MGDQNSKKKKKYWGTKNLVFKIEVQNFNFLKIGESKVHLSHILWRKFI
jgi:hypothetical protein